MIYDLFQYDPEVYHLTQYGIEGVQYVVNEDDGSWHIDLPRLIGDVMVGREQITGSELKEQVCNRANIGSWKFYNKLLEQAVNERIIMKTFDKVGHVIYTPAPF